MLRELNPNKVRVFRLSTPPAITALQIPALTRSAASLIAFIPEVQAVEIL